MKNCPGCVIDECSAADLSIIETIKTVRDRCGVPLAEAKQLVAEHPLYEKTAKVVAPILDDLLVEVEGKNGFSTFEARLLIHFLDVLGDMLGNAGCNDFDLAPFVPRHEDRMKLIRKSHELNGDLEEYDAFMSPDESGTYLADFCVVALLKHWIESNITEGEE
jgi:hypothetical protein